MPKTLCKIAKIYSKYWGDYFNKSKTLVELSPLIQAPGHAN